MPTRRHFLGVAVAGTMPVALMPHAAPLLAQTPAPPAAVRDAVLLQLATEMGRLHRDAGTAVPNAEPYRAAAACLRILAALDLDREVATSLRALARARGRAWLLAMPVDTAEVTTHLTPHGFTLRGDDLGLTARPLPAREAALDHMLEPGYSLSDSVRSLAAGLDRVGTPTGDRAAAPAFRVTNFENCIEYRQMLVYLQFGLVVLCASGNTPGCIATAASIALIQHLLFVAGC